MKRSATLLLSAVLLLVLGGRAEAAAPEELLYRPDGATYQLSYRELPDHTLEITGTVGNTEGQTLILPADIGGKTVTSIDGGRGKNGSDHTLGGVFRNDLVIPDTVTRVQPDSFAEVRLTDGDLKLGKGLPHIGPRAFFHLRLDRGDIRIPDGVETIGEEAFAQWDHTQNDEHITGNVQSCNSRLFLGKDVRTIGDRAFYCCTIRGDLVIPDSVTSIGESAFNMGRFQNSADSLTLGSGLEALGTDAFRNFHVFRTLTIQPAPLTVIPAGAFAYGDFSGTLTVPEGITEIGDYAFMYSKFSSIVLPDSLRTLGVGAFNRDFQLKSLDLGSGVEEIGGFAFTSCGLEGTLTIPASVNTVGESAFEGLPITGLRLPEGVETIGPHAFGMCTELTGNLILPDSLRVMGEGAFSNDGQLNGSLVLGSGLKRLEKDCFYGCSFRDPLVLPQGIETVGGFRECTTLFTVPDFPDSVTEIGDSAFEGCFLTGQLNLPAGLKRIGSGAFYSNDLLTGTLTIPRGVTEIGEMAFFGCGGLTGSLTIPDSVTALGRDAFRDCTGFNGDLTVRAAVDRLTRDMLPPLEGFTGSLTVEGSGATELASGLFYGTGFTGDLVLRGVGKVGDHCFSSCAGLTGTLTLGEGLTDIGDGAFSGAALRGPLTLPSTLRSLGTGATSADGVFENCTGLTGGLTFPAGLQRIGESCFEGCTGLTGPLTFPPRMDGTLSLDRNCFRGGGFQGNFRLPDGVEFIGDGAFDGCAGLTGDFCLPEGLRILGEMAFRGCSGLTGDVRIPESLEELGRMAFQNCTGFDGSLIFHPYSRCRVYSLATEFSGCTGFTGDLVLPKTNVADYHSLDGAKFSGTLNLMGMSEYNQTYQKPLAPFAFREWILPAYFRPVILEQLSRPQVIRYRGTRTMWNAVWPDFDLTGVELHCLDDQSGEYRIEFPVTRTDRVELRVCNELQMTEQPEYYVYYAFYDRDGRMLSLGCREESRFTRTYDPMTLVLTPPREAGEVRVFLSMKNWEGWITRPCGRSFRTELSAAENRA